MSLIKIEHEGLKLEYTPTDVMFSFSDLMGKIITCLNDLHTKDPNLAMDYFSCIKSIDTTESACNIAFLLSGCFDMTDDDIKAIDIFTSKRYIN